MLLVRPGPRQQSNEAYAPVESGTAKPRSLTEMMAPATTPAATARCTRRLALALVSLSLVGLVLRPGAALAGAVAGPSIGDAPTATAGSTSLHQEIEFNAAPRRIHDLLLDAKGFSAFTGDAAEVAPNAGQAFSLFGGRITGRNVELVPPERIVQAWRSASWEPGVYSVVRFGLAARSAKTLLVLDHTGFPEGLGEHLAAGWREHYWEPLGKFLG